MVLTSSEAWSHVLYSLSQAYVNRSKLPGAVLALEGFSGAKTRHFYNNICSAPWVKYLEVGVWKGSTFASALYGNVHCHATAIDNWSQFAGSAAEFETVALEHIRAPYTLYDADCFKTVLPDKDYTVFMFDGLHTYDAQRQAITHFWRNLASVAVVIIDDWNWADVRNGTMDGFVAVGANITYSHEIRYTHDNEHTPMHIAKTEFWNGVGVFVIQK